jgi:hypothetical protein
LVGFTLLSCPVLSQRTVPDGYDLMISDDFDSINSVYWSRGLQDDTPGSDKGLIWNKITGGTNLLNDNHAGYITDEDSYVENGVLFLRNQERVYQGTDLTINVSDLK